MLSILGIYSPKMKGANWLKFICHQGRSLVNNFSLSNNWYKSVVLLLIWLHSLVCQIHNKQMSQLVAYSGNICVWVVSCNECGGWQLGWCSGIIKKDASLRCVREFKNLLLLFFSKKILPHKEKSSHPSTPSPTPFFVCLFCFDKQLVW